MKFLLFFLAWIAFSGLAVAQNINTFRKTYWGMTRPEVVKAEAPIKPNTNTPDWITFNAVPLGEAKCRLIYGFNDNALVHSQYYYKPTNQDSHSAILLYYEAQELLKEKYGEGLNEKDKTAEQLQEIAPVHSALLSVFEEGGLVQFYEAWKTPSTLVLLSFWQQKDKPLEMPVVMVDYYSIYAKPSSFKLKKPSSEDF